MVKNQKDNWYQTTDERLYGTQHRPSRLLDQGTLKRCFHAYQSDLISDLCKRINVIDMQQEVTSEIEPEIEDVRNDFDATVDSDGDTLLHVAIILNQSYTAMELISNAPNRHYLSVQNNIYQTPLHLSVLTKQLDVCRMLLTSGAEIESRDKNGDTALHIACREGLQDLVQCLLESKQYRKRIAYDCRWISRTNPLSIRNYNGYTCLHLAAMNGQTEIVKLLIENGADINTADGKAGRSVLHDACISGNLQLVKLLLQYKSCDINVRAYDGSTPFDLARDRGHHSVCTVLAAAGARENDTGTYSE